MEKQEITARLRQVRAQIVALAEQVNILESELDPEIARGGIRVTVGDVRKVAILEEVQRAGGAVSPADLSKFARKYGRDPSSCAGYFSGKKPSLKASRDKKQRILTNEGLAALGETSREWGADWFERIPLDKVENPDTMNTTIIIL
jgi:hypothetical protein